MSQLSNAQKETIHNCVYRSPQAVTKVDCGQGCCERRLTRIYKCLKHGPDQFVTFGLCDPEKTVVAACVYCTMAATADMLSPDEQAEFEGLKANFPGF
jgi:hypothetical protein